MKLLPDILANIETDFKAEVIAAEMAESGVNPEQIMIVMLGPQKRIFSKDVESVTEETSDYNHKDYTLVKTHKEGIYDMLPEGLFHTNTTPKSAISDKDIIGFMKKQRAEELDARHFFLPYEAAINHLRMQMYIYEGRLDKGSHHAELVNVFSGHWEIFRYFDNRQSGIFLQVLPLIHDLRDNYPVAETIFQLILALKVSVTLQQQSLLKPEVPISSTLANTLLGINFTTGNKVYNSGENEIRVKLGPLTNLQLKQFNGGEKNQKILELLCDYFLPAHIDVITEYILTEVDKITRLADGESDYNSTMGLNTYL